MRGLAEPGPESGDRVVAVAKTADEADEASGFAADGAKAAVTSLPLLRTRTCAGSAPPLTATATRTSPPVTRSGSVESDCSLTVPRSFAALAPAGVNATSATANRTIAAFLMLPVLLRSLAIAPLSLQPPPTPLVAVAPPSGVGERRFRARIGRPPAVGGEGREPKNDRRDRASLDPEVTACKPVGAARVGGEPQDRDIDRN